MPITSVTATINGVPTELNWNAETSKYEATIQAPAETSGSNNAGQGPGVGENAQGKGYYPVSITAENSFGASVTVNDDTEGAVGQACRLKVLEKVVPTLSAVYPTEGALVTNSTPEFDIQFTDSGSGINTASCQFLLDGEPQTLVFDGTNASPTRNGKYTPSQALADGNHTFTCTIADFDGNTSTQLSVSFTVDATDPALNITAPVEGASINTTTVQLVGTVSDSVGVKSVVCQVNSPDNQQTVTVGAGGAFNQTITGLTDATQNTLTIIATDTSGRTTTIVRHVNVNTTGPVIVSVTITPNPADAGATYTLSVECTSP